MFGSPFSMYLIISRIAILHVKTFGSLFSLLPFMEWILARAPAIAKTWCYLKLNTSIIITSFSCISCICGHMKFDNAIGHFYKFRTSCSFDFCIHQCYKRENRALLPIESVPTRSWLWNFRSEFFKFSCREWVRFFWVPASRIRSVVGLIKIQKINSI